MNKILTSIILLAGVFAISSCSKKDSYLEPYPPEAPRWGHFSGTINGNNYNLVNNRDNWLVQTEKTGLSETQDGQPLPYMVWTLRTGILYADRSLLWICLYDPRAPGPLM